MTSTQGASVQNVSPCSQAGSYCVHVDEAEATFMPPKSFPSQPALWCIDLLKDLTHDFELVRRHAIMEWAGSIALSNPQVAEAGRLRVFRDACKRLCIDIPEDLEALRMLANGFKADRPKPP